MNVPNKNRTVTRTAFILGLLFIAGIFVPGLLGIDGFNGGFALSAASVFFAIIALVTAFVYSRLAKAQDAILSGDGQLARWEYSDDEWARFTEREHENNKKDKKFLFYIIAGFAVFFGILFPIMDPESGPFVSLVMLGLIVLIAFVAWLSVTLAHRSNLKHKGFAVIAKTGVFLNGTTSAWGMLGGKLEGVKLLGKDPADLEFTFTTPGGRGGRQFNTVRVAVPKGKEKEADAIVNKF